MRVFITLLLGSMVICSSAHAQKGPEKDEDEPICVGGCGWRATYDETSAIKTTPVPDSYRVVFESTDPCARWAMEKGGIVDWHFRFGSAATLSMALRYIERDSRRSIPAPTAYLPRLRRAFALAMPDLKRASALKQPPGLSFSVNYRFMENSKPVIRLNELLRARDEYVFLAGRYLRAAEEFVDPKLLGEAEIYLSTASTAADFLSPLEDEPSVQGLLNFNLQRYETDDLLARAALL